MAKARPLRNAAGKPRAKARKTESRATSSGAPRKPAVARAPAAGTRVGASAPSVMAAKPAPRQPVAIAETVAPPPLPSPIASFTF